MRILDGDKQIPLRNVQLYLTPREAEKFCQALKLLLVDPDANEHEHVFAEDASREISVSLLTPAKLRDLSGYSKAERKMFEER